MYHKLILAEKMKVKRGKRLMFCFSSCQSFLELFKHLKNKCWNKSNYLKDFYNFMGFKKFSYSNPRKRKTFQTFDFKQDFSISPSELQQILKNELLLKYLIYVLSAWNKLCFCFCKYFNLIILRLAKRNQKKN